MTKAFGYLRVSGKGQVDGDGFPRQLAAIKAYAAAHDIKIVKVFREEGVPGATEWEDRPAWMEMIGALNGVRAIVIEKLDRLARELMVQEHIIVDLQRRGIELTSVHEPDLGSSDPSRVLFRQLMGAVAQYEKAMIVAKLRGARERTRQQTGRCEGRKPYGERPGESTMLARMKQLRADGLGFDRIAAAMNAEGLKPRQGERWHGLVVNRLLTGRRPGERAK
jgi:DNA invertase Pin-like site-specific DNA recombinase